MPKFTSEVEAEINLLICSLFDHIHTTIDEALVDVFDNEYGIVKGVNGYDAIEQRILTGVREFLQQEIK